MISGTTFSKQIKRPGSTQRTINVDRSGQPFGQLWTWPNTRMERHPWHAKPIHGTHRTFDKLAEAKEYMRTA